MLTDQQGNSVWTGRMRWIARVTGLLASAPFAVFLIYFGGECYGKLSWSSPQGLPLFWALVGAMVGSLFAWQWELVGGVVALLCAVAINVLVVWGSGNTVLIVALVVSAPYFIAGGLFLACSRSTGRACQSS